MEEPGPRPSPRGRSAEMLMADLPRRRATYASAERVAADVAKEDPADAEQLRRDPVQMVGAQAVEAVRNRGDRAEAKRLDDRAAALIYE